MNGEEIFLKTETEMASFIKATESSDLRSHTMKEKDLTPVGCPLTFKYTLFPNTHTFGEHTKETSKLV